LKFFRSIESLTCRWEGFFSPRQRTDHHSPGRGITHYTATVSREGATSPGEPPSPILQEISLRRLRTANHAISGANPPPWNAGLQIPWPSLRLPPEQPCLLPHSLRGDAPPSFSVSRGKVPWSNYRFLYFKLSPKDYRGANNFFQDSSYTLYLMPHEILLDGIIQSPAQIIEIPVTGSEIFHPGSNRVYKCYDRTVLL
jgi:hypothetical protein